MPRDPLSKSLAGGDPGVPDASWLRGVDATCTESPEDVEYARIQNWRAAGESTIRCTHEEYLRCFGLRYVRSVHRAENGQRFVTLIPDFDAKMDVDDDIREWPESAKRFVSPMTKSCGESLTLRVTMSALRSSPGGLSGEAMHACQRASCRPNTTTINPCLPDRSKHRNWLAFSETKKWHPTWVRSTVPAETSSHLPPVTQQ